MRGHASCGGLLRYGVVCLNKILDGAQTKARRNERLVRIFSVPGSPVFCYLDERHAAIGYFMNGAPCWKQECLHTTDHQIRCVCGRAAFSWLFDVCAEVVYRNFVGAL